MERKAITGIMLTLFLIFILSVSVNSSQSYFVETWIPYVPSSKMVDLKFRMLNGISYIDISITFSDCGFMVSNWGTVVSEGNDFWVNSEIWDWTGPACLMIITESYTYTLGYLEGGNYTFTFKTWEFDVKSISFTVPSKPQLLLETDKDVYILGENVKITLKNIGTETVMIGGYPAWQIYSYPEEEFVYPSIFAFLLWSLNPGENDTFTWNQYNAFTKSPADPGIYVVRDTHAWGLSAFFEITTSRVVTATVDMDPPALNLKSEGEWVTAHIELPEGYSVNDIDASSLKLNKTFSVDLNTSALLGDYDNDGVPDLTVKFNRTELTSYIYYVLGIKYGNITLTITGKLTDGTLLEGSDIIEVFFGGDIDGDGYVGPIDLSMFAASYGKKAGQIGYNPYADLDYDKYVGPLDLSIFAVNYGKHV